MPLSISIIYVVFKRTDKLVYTVHNVNRTIFENIHTTNKNKKIFINVIKIRSIMISTQAE